MMTVMGTTAEIQVKMLVYQESMLEKASMKTPVERHASVTSALTREI